MQDTTSLHIPRAVAAQFVGAQTPGQAMHSIRPGKEHLGDYRHESGFEENETWFPFGPDLLQAPDSLPWQGLW